MFFLSEISYRWYNHTNRQRHLAMWVTCAFKLADWNFHPMHKHTFWECFMSLNSSRRCVMDQC